METVLLSRLEGGLEHVAGELRTADTAIDDVGDEVTRRRLRRTWERLGRARKAADDMLRRLDREPAEAAKLLAKDLEREVCQLEAEVGLLAAEVRGELATTTDAYRTAAGEQLRAWRGRLDELRVQASLARMEIRDDVDAVLDRMEGHYHEAAHHLRMATTSTTLSSLRQAVRRLFGDVREAADAARDELARPAER
ncbi:MAG: hypothetical protein AB1679_01770 [Actinomycetota bacterium]|jgi:uncharacterized protein YicC (UPF0701 family)